MRELTEETGLGAADVDAGARMVTRRRSASASR